MVNLKALEAAINRVESIHHHEFSFEVDGQEITLRILRPSEEAEVQKYAQVALENVQDGGADQGAYMDLMNRMRQATLGFSIVQLGELDLRKIEFLETGEVDAQGRPVSMLKWEALCGLVADWSQHMLSEVSQKYGDLVDRVEIHAQKVVKYEPIDLDAEITRVESRLKDLRLAKTKRDGTVTGGPIPEMPQQPAPPPQQADVQGAVDDVVGSQEAGAQQSQNPYRAQNTQPQAQPSQSPQGRPSPLPEQGAPTERSPQSEAPAQSQEPQASPYVDDVTGIPLPHEGDSFFDPSDPGQAMEVETRRLAMLHQQKVARERAQAEEARMRQEMGIPSEQEHAQQLAENQRDVHRPKAVDLSGAGAGSSVQGLRQAANLQDAAFDTQAGSIQAGRPPKTQPQVQGGGKPAKLHGKDVYKMPTQTLEKPQDTRKHGQPAPGPMQMNPSAGSRNPNFRGKGS